MSLPQAGEAVAITAKSEIRSSRLVGFAGAEVRGLERPRFPRSRARPRACCPAPSVPHRTIPCGVFTDASSVASAPCGQRNRGADHAEQRLVFGISRAGEKCADIGTGMCRALSNPIRQAQAGASAPAAAPAEGVCRNVCWSDRRGRVYRTRSALAVPGDGAGLQMKPSLSNVALSGYQVIPMFSLSWNRCRASLVIGP